MSPVEGSIQVRDSGALRTITINRPAKKNAITGPMYASLTAALAEAKDAERTTVVMIGAAGDAFSAGNDIGDFLRSATGSAEADSARGGPAFLRELAFFPKPIVAAVNGLAIGIGATMLLHCDLVVASSAASFQFPFTRLALVPEAAASVLLPARVGLQRASEWLMLGERIDADTALRSGLVNAVVPPDQLGGAAIARAEALMKLAPGALRETKRLIREPLHAAIEAALTRELESFARRLTSPEAAAAFTAFLARGK